MFCIDQFNVAIYLQNLYHPDLIFHHYKLSDSLNQSIKIKTFSIIVAICNLIAQL